MRMNHQDLYHIVSAIKARRGKQKDKIIAEWSATEMDLIMETGPNLPLSTVLARKNSADLLSRSEGVDLADSILIWGKCGWDWPCKGRDVCAILAPENRKFKPNLYSKKPAISRGQAGSFRTPSFVVTFFAECRLVHLWCGICSGSGFLGGSNLSGHAMKKGAISIWKRKKDTGHWSPFTTCKIYITLFYAATSSCTENREQKPIWINVSTPHYSQWQMYGEGLWRSMIQSN